MFEQIVIRYFKKYFSNLRTKKGLFKKLGLVFGNRTQVKYNIQTDVDEFDILIYNTRTIHGIPINIANIEIEERPVTNGTINQKYSGDFLLSFITKQPIESNGMVYSNSYFSEGLNMSHINLYADNIINLAKTKRNIECLESLLGSYIEQRLKQATLFFLGDLLIQKVSINEYQLRHIFYEPSINYIRCIFGDGEHNKKWVHFLIDSKGVREQIKNNNIKIRLKNYLRSKYRNQITLHNNDEINLLVLKGKQKNNIELICEDSEISRIFYISGTSNEVSESSIIKIV